MPDRLAIVGNAAGGKSTLARAVAGHRGLKLIEIDRLLWQPGWKLTPAEQYSRQHAETVAEDAWVIEGLGRQDSIPARLARATEIILVDLPLWVHFWLAAERQMAWMEGRLGHLPAGAETMPPTRDLFRTIWEVEQAWMPGIRAVCDEAQQQGKLVVRLNSIEELTAFAEAVSDGVWPA
jgi:adenylate kinase family enzyme